MKFSELIVVITGVASALMGIGAGSAADLPVKAPALIAAAPYSFSGLYGGVNAGYSVGDSPSTVIATDGISPVPFQNDAFRISPHGVVGGAQLGYNWQPSNWLFGLEADIQASSQKSTVCLIYCVPGEVGYTVEQRLPWFGTLRGRLGYVVDETLFYATGGLAFGRVENNGVAVNGLPASTGSVSGARTGWTVGGGMETALGGNWTGKIEYLHTDLGSRNLTLVDASADIDTLNTTIRDNIVRVGVNYRLSGAPASAASVPVMALKAPTSRLGYDWSGVYGGVNVGYGLARDPTLYDVTGIGGDNFSHETFDTMPGGVLGGVQIGYNRQFASHWVAGVEADVQGTGQTDRACVFVCNGPSNGIPSSGNVDQKLRWFSTVRGRLGMDTGHALVYATGGFAAGQAEINVSQSIVPVNSGASTAGTRTGWTVGGGIEAPVTRNLTVKFEYLYMDLGSQTVAFNTGSAGILEPTTTTVTAPLRDNIFRVGVNYLFQAGPLVANY
jgi:outer membrane immunogenic protein